ncbi:Rossmann-fold NAD(P)-binding domain-containing protein [Paraburkholderia sediminicola]|uniref:epimerase n=1 Tax=Paraburkholderia sediminicola TaxID=458836 RepID=UPI000E71DB9E
MRALVVGGTGPTGPYIVRGLLKRGYEVTLFHRGTHESDEIPACVEHIHGDPHFRETIEASLVGREFDLVLATYGRLRHLSSVLRGRTNRFIGIGGVAVYRGYKEPERLFPQGMLVPTRESDSRVEDDEEVRFSRLMSESEDAVFTDHPGATLFRYPYVYGPNQLIPREWCVIRRVLDHRSHIIVPEGGLMLATHGYAENLAHAVLLAVDQPQAAAGQAYNCGDEMTMTVRQLIEVIAQAMGATLKIVSVPNEVAIASRALTMREDLHHWVMDISKLQRELGYHDLVHPVTAVRETVMWYLQNPPERGGEIEQRLADPFDYEIEDRVIAAQATALDELHRAIAGVTTTRRPHAYAHPRQPGERDHRAR